MLFQAMHIIHLLIVIIWIGGLAFITIILLPMVVKMPDALQKVLLFQRVEHKFAPLARVLNAVTGITGAVMVGLNGWHKILFTKQGAPLLLMIIIWALWFVMLFGLEPIIIKKMLAKMAASGEKMEIETVFARMNRMHKALLLISLVASAAGVVFAHGYL